jgi:hypothetical protein
VRQWIEPTHQTVTSQLSLEDHGGISPRVCGRASASACSSAVGVWHCWLLREVGEVEEPGRHFINDDH